MCLYALLFSQLCVLWTFQMRQSVQLEKGKPPETLTKTVVATPEE